MNRPQRTCTECGQSSGNHHTGCPETPDEPETPVNETEQAEDDTQEDAT